MKVLPNNVVTVVLMAVFAVAVAGADDDKTKCKRTGQGINYANADEFAINEEITSTADYLDFNEKKIEKVLVPTKDVERSNVDDYGNTYYQDGEKMFIRPYGAKKSIAIEGISIDPNRTIKIFPDKAFSLTFVGTQDGIYVLRCGGTRAVQLIATKNITVDFGMIDGHGNIYFGTDGSNARRSEQLYVFNRTTNSLVKIGGIETSLGSYPIDSHNRRKIAIDSKNNVYVGAYSNYVYQIKSGDTMATKIKDNRDYGGVTAIVVDSKDNVYCRTYTELLVYKNGRFNKILETDDYFDLFVSVDGNDDVHFKIAGEELMLTSKDISAVEVNGFPGDNKMILHKNLMVRNNIFYFTTRTNNGDNDDVDADGGGGGDGDVSETIWSIKSGETNVTKVYTIDDEYHSVTIDGENNIYFTAASNKIATKIVPYVLRSNARMPIEIRGVTGRFIKRAYADNRNNVYFSASNGLHVLNFDEVIPHRLRATSGNVSSVVVAQGDNIYFGTHYDGAFVLKRGESEAIRVNGITEENEVLSVVEVFTDQNYDDIVYFQTNDGTLYKLTSGDTNASRVVEKANLQFYLSDCQDNIYYVSGNVVYLFQSNSSTAATPIARIFGQILSIGIDSSNRLYFATTIGLQVLNVGDTKASMLAGNVLVNTLAIDQDDNVYFGTNVGAFVLKSGLSHAIKGIDEAVVKIFLNLQDIYFITNEGRRLFVLQNKLEIGSFFTNRILGVIDDNNDDTILNSLNYLHIGNDYLLNRGKNELLNKTETSAIVRATKGKYFGQFSVQFTIRNRRGNDAKFFVDINFLKKAIFFNYINENLFRYRNPKDIKEIEVFIGNLRFSPVSVERDSNLSSSFEFRNICDMKRVANPSPVNQIIKFSECNYNGKETISFTVTTGIHTPQNEPFQTILSPSDEAIISDYLYNNDEYNEPITLSDVFQLSDTNYFSKETIVYNFSEPEQDIVVPPKQQISVKYSVRTFTNRIALKLTQKIYGVIVSKLTDNTDEQIVQITLRNAMQVLEKYSQLPVEVVINDDNSVTFSGKAMVVSQRESVPNIIRNFV